MGNAITSSDNKWLKKEIKKMEQKHKIVNDKNLPNLVNFSTNKEKNYHNWFEYKEGYSEELIEMLLNKFSYKKGDKILDPFSGVGTTLITGKKLGLNPIGFDVNPVSLLASEAKLSYYSKQDTMKLKEILKEINLDKRKLAKKPKLEIIDKVFNSDILKELLSLKKYIDNYQDENIYFLLKTAYVSILEKLSNVKKDGNGIKYQNKNYERNVLDEFKKKIKHFIKDIESDYYPKESEKIKHKLYHDSFLNAMQYPELKEGSIEHIIFSPPYANCFDYSAVYKVELWMGEYIIDYKDFKKIRSASIRSHVNGSLKNDLTYTYDLIEEISDKLKKIDLWDKKIPFMLNAYFDDMTKSLQNCYELNKINGHCAIVVANSSYKGYVIPTDLMLATIAEKVGYKVLEIIECRKLNTSSQQIKRNQIELTNYMRESLIILKKEAQND